MKTIDIKTIADELECCFDGWNQFLNTETGEIVSLSDGMWSDWTEEDEALAEEIDMSGNYVRLPNQYEIHAWRIMEAFAEEIPAAGVKARLLRALHGKKAYRHFKDEIINLGIQDAYYAYRSREILEIAKAWCEENEIPYK